MVKIIFWVSFVLFSSGLSAQQKDFEGIIYYTVSLTSKSDLFSEKVLKTMLGMSNNYLVWIKQGNYRQSSDINDIYYLTKEQRVYIRFKKLDTLYYLEYNSDTSEVKKISHPNEKSNIAGLDCKLLSIRLNNSNIKYYYSPSLYMNPEYDKNNTIGHYDIFAKETSSLYLQWEEETIAYIITATCSHLKQTAVPDSIFQLPSFPKKKFSPDELTIPPEFTRPGGWAGYLQKSINPEITNHYLKIPPGTDSASQTVMVRFLVNEFGRVTYAEVENKKEVHPKLAEEALRVVNASPTWKPATIYGGEKAFYWLREPITFVLLQK